MTAFLPIAASAGIIDTTGSVGYLTFSVPNGADTFGGSFVADADTLVSFSLFAHNDSSAPFRAVVVGFSGGTPGNSVLWESADVFATSTGEEFTFTPGISLTPGNSYFIGLDNGNMTSVAGAGIYGLGFNSSNPIANGGSFSRFNGGGSFSSYSSSTDIASRIVMADTASVPEPNSIFLTGMGLVAFGIFRRRRS